MASRDLTVHIIGDSRSLERAYARSNRAGEQFQRRTSRTLTTLARGAAFGGIAAGVTALIGTLKVGVDEFSEQARVAAQTNAVLKSTGGIANVTARELEGLSGALSRMSGIDDELIQRGGNLLLTFKQVRNEAGKGNDVFNRATKAALDLSVAGFGSVETTAKQLGKALNDPIRGMTALGRAGVTFTESQRKQIRTLVESGRALEAQKLILREVESQVGGSARALGQTLPGAIARARIAFENFAGSAVARAAPTIERFALRAVDAFNRISAWVRENEQSLRQIWQDAADAVRIFARIVGPVLGPALRVIAASLSLQIRILAKVARAWRFLASVVQQVIGGILRAIDGFLGGLSALTDAASRIPGVGDKFKGISDKVNAARERVRGFADELDKIGDKTISVNVRIGVTGAGSLPEAAQHLRNFAAATEEVEAVAKKVAQPTGPNITPDQRNNWFDAMIGRRLNRVQDIRSLEAQLAELRRIAALIQARIAITKDITRKLTLEDTLLDVRREQRNVLAQIRDATVQARERAKQLAEQRKALEQERRERELIARNARQFRALGLTAEGDEPIPGVKALRRQLGRIGDAVKGTFLDTSKTRSLLSRIRKVLSGSLGAISRDVREKIAAMLADLNRQLNDQATGPATKFHKANANALLAGLGLDPEQIRVLRARLSQVGAGGSVHPSGFGAFGVPLVVGQPIVVQHTTTLDGRTIEQSTTSYQQKRARSNPPQKRGVLQP